VLISRNLVLTAAHNLYDKKSQQEFNKKTYKFYYEAKDGIATKFYEVADWRFLQ
jgi:V8-like Glu-specific endopeptidase